MLSAGTCTIGPGELALTGSGLALSIAQASYAAWVAFMAQAGTPLNGPRMPGVSQNVTAFAAALGNALAAAIVTEIQTNGEAVVTTQSLGVLPATIAAGQPIAPPATTVTIPIQ